MMAAKGILILQLALLLVIREAAPIDLSRGIPESPESCPSSPTDSSSFSTLTAGSALDPAECSKEG